MKTFKAWMKDLEKVAHDKGYLPDATFRAPHVNFVWKPRYNAGMTPEEAWDADTAAITGSLEWLRSRAEELRAAGPENASELEMVERNIADCESSLSGKPDKLGE